jgi:hypothetical protein
MTYFFILKNNFPYYKLFFTKSKIFIYFFILFILITFNLEVSPEIIEIFDFSIFSSLLKKFMISLFTFHFSGIHLDFIFIVQSSISQTISVFCEFGTTFIVKTQASEIYFCKSIKNILFFKFFVYNSSKKYNFNKKYENLN